MSSDETQELAMKIIELPFAVLRLQYRIARHPLQLIEDRLATSVGAANEPL